MAGQIAFSDTASQAMPDAESSMMFTPPPLESSPATTTPTASQGTTSLFPGATVYTPTSTPGIELNPRSCVTCRRRKVRCDKHMPCSNCRRTLIPCIFPAPERAPRRPRRKDTNTLKPHQSSEREIELLKRLRKLEGIVEDLSGQVELETSKQHSSNGNSPETGTGFHVGADAAAAHGHGSATVRGHISPTPSNANMPLGSDRGKALARSNSNLSKQGREAGQQFGRLVINDSGRTRYISSVFWGKINDELDELRAGAKRISQPDSDESDAESSPLDGESNAAAASQSFVFGFQSSAVDLQPLHPWPSQIPYIWQVYQENVDPLVKILHIPTTSKLIREARTSLDTISPSAEALMFAIYYAAITSLDENEIRVNFMAEKDFLIKKYRYGLEQALAKANFLVSSETVTLQAFILYVVLIRRHDDTRLSWTMTGLAIRISLSLGLHRDGSHFPNLRPFEVEMRRRLFWALCVLDMRSAEDQGSDLSITDSMFDTQFPLNLNDADIHPDSLELPPAREGSTDMTYSLIRYEICAVARRLHALSSASGLASGEDSVTVLEERERLIHEVYNRVETKYLKGGDVNTNAMSVVAANIARVICAKMTLVIYQPFLLPTPGNEDMSRDLRDRLFTASTELFEYSAIVTTDPRTRQWRWLFQTYTQWHGVAYILIECARRPWSASVERAWNALTSTMANFRTQDLEKIVDNTSLWMPFKMLYGKAHKHRTAQLQMLREHPEEVARLDSEDRARLAPTIFAAIHGSLDGFQWRERWLQLVNGQSLIDGNSLPQGGSTLDAVMSQSTQPSLAPASTLPCKAVQENSPLQEQQQQYAKSASESAVDFLDRVFRQPTFEATEFIPIVMSSQDLAKDLAGTEDYTTFGATDMQGQGQGQSQGQGQDAAMAPFVASTSSGLATGNSDNTATTLLAGPANIQPPLLDGIGGQNAPPWLWMPNDTGLQPMGLFSDDVDINMDENFDWQNFGQNLGGVTNGIWSSHGL